jgi:hypothetical protein
MLQFEIDLRFSRICRKRNRNYGYKFHPAVANRFENHIALPEESDRAIFVFGM